MSCFACCHLFRTVDFHNLRGSMSTMYRKSHNHRTLPKRYTRRLLFPDLDTDRNIRSFLRAVLSSFVYLFDTLPGHSGHILRLEWADTHPQGSRCPDTRTCPTRKSRSEGHSLLVGLTARHRNRLCFRVRLCIGIVAFRPSDNSHDQEHTHSP